MKREITFWFFVKNALRLILMKTLIVSGILFGLPWVFHAIFLPNAHSFPIWLFVLPGIIMTIALILFFTVLLSKRARGTFALKMMERKSKLASMLRSYGKEEAVKKHEEEQSMWYKYFEKMTMPEWLREQRLTETKFR